MTEEPRPLSGRRAEAARNDQRILDAARVVFLADPKAPISAVAERAGVGIAALYRRYRSKDELLQQLALDGLRRHNELVQAALDEDGDPWGTFARYLERTIAAGGGALSRRLSGTFTVTEELREEGVRAVMLTQELIARTKAAGVLREEVEATDISLLSEALQGVAIGDRERDAELRLRYLAVVVAGLRRPAYGAGLPSRAPRMDEMARRYGHRDE